MTNTATARRLTARQLAKALAEIDVQISALTAIEAQFGALYETTGSLLAIGDAWNATSDAIAALYIRRAEVQANELPVAQTTTWALIQQNID